uniref:Ribonuclease HII n=1 Tax=Lygus hesperus TaxID=30085 RepID=A0A0A9ZD22_LYGHE
MSEHHSDDEEMVGEVVLYGATRTTVHRRSLVDSLLASNPTPDVMVTLGSFANIISGRIFLLQSSKRTDELMVLSEDDIELDGVGTINTYLTLVMASVLKKRLQTHHFYSNHCVDILGSNPKRRKRSADPDLLYKCQLKKNLDGICDVALELENPIATEKKLYTDALNSDLQFPGFLSSFREKIQDLKSSLNEQVINQELKQRNERERDEIKFVGELCSRLLVVTPFKNPKVKNAFKITENILNRVNGVLQ